MRVLVLLCFLCVSAHVSACQRPITISYGPFVSLLMVERFFGEFHSALSQATDCKVSFVLHRDFENYMLSLFNRESMLVITPGEYSSVAVQIDYEVVASLQNEGIRKFFVVTQQKSDIQHLTDLVGRTVLVNSPLSSSGSYFLSTLSEQGLMDKVTIEYMQGYDNLFISVLKGKADAAVVLEEYLNLVDERIKSNQLKVVARVEAPSTTEFVILKEHSELIPKVRAALEKSTLDWGAPHLKPGGSKSLEALLRGKWKDHLETEGNTP